MKKVILLFLILAVSALVNTRLVVRKKLNAKRQIFDTIDFNKDFSRRLSPNQIILKGYDKPATYLPPTKFVPSTYIPPDTTTRSTTPKPITITTKKVTPSTPGPTYIVPKIDTTTRRITTIPTLRPIPPYTGTYPTYTYSTYNYTFTGTYPTTPVTFRPFVSTTTTPRPTGYFYAQPSLSFDESRKA